MVIPKHGYLTEIKDAYRKDVWRQFALLTDDPENAKVLMLPSNHSAEIEEALKIGIKEENIYACDENAAMLATAPWRKKYPKINILGNKLTRAMERLQERKIKIDIANLDLCTNLSKWMFEDIISLLKLLLKDKIILGLTLLKGRETSSETTLARMLFKGNNNVADRIEIVFQHIKSQPNICAAMQFKKEYKSGRQKMVYGVFDIISSDFFVKKADIIFETFREDIVNTLKVDADFYKINYGEPCANYYEKNKKKREKKKNLLKKYWKRVNKIKKKVEALLHDEVYKYAGAGATWFWNFGGIKTLYYKMIEMPYHRID